MNYDLSKTYVRYAYDVVNHDITACKTVQQQCERFLSWFDFDDRYFDYDDVDRKIRFVAKLKHSTGIHANHHFELLPWQQFAFAGIFGWKYRSTKLRIVHNAFIFISRKNGKSALSAALALATLLVDNEPGAEVDIVANSSKQASILFDMCKNFAESIDPKGAIFQRYRSDIKVPLTKSIIQIHSSDSMSLDGWNSSVGIFDEIHAAKDWSLYNVLKSSQGMRTQPLMLCITTAGFLVGEDYPCYSLYTTGKQILNKVYDDDSFFPLIYELDEGDDWKDETKWIKCCPSLGQTVFKDYMVEQVTAATNTPSLEVGVLTKTFNKFCQSETTWIPAESVKQVTKAFDYSDFNHSSSEYRCLVGADLAERGDLCVLSTLIHYEGKYWFKAYPFICESALEKGKNKELYQRWVREGHLICVPGKSIDIEWIVGYLMEITEDCPVMGIAYDPKFATQFCIAANKAGLPTIPVNQGLAAFSEPTSVLEHLIMTEQAVIDDNPVIRWCFANVLLKYDFNGNKKPVKSADANKIDIIIAFLQTVKMQMEIEGMNDVNLEACVLS